VLGQGHALKPAVSVIVAVYNIEAYIGECLESLEAQTLSEIEFIIVNDGATDGSQEIIDSFASRDSNRFRTFIKPNGGLSSARNFGLAQARGDYVAFVDGDDYVLPHMYERLYEKATQTDADLVVCGYLSVDQRTGKKKYHRQGLPEHYGGPISEKPSALVNIASYAWNKLYRRSLFDDPDMLFPVGRLFEDIPVVYPLMARANRVEKVQEGLYVYRRFREGAITHSYSPRNLEMLEMLERVNEFYYENSLFDPFYSELQLLNFRHLFNRFTELPRYRGLGLKHAFVMGSYNILDQQFPGWRKSPRLAANYAMNWRYGFFLHPGLSRIYASSPRVIHQLVDLVVPLRNRVSSLYRRVRGRFSRKRLLHLRYARSCRELPVDPHVALFESYHGKSICDQPFYLMKDLAARDTHRIYVSAKNPANAKRFLKRYGIDASPVIPYSDAYNQVLATAGYLVNNVTFPHYFVRRQGQTYLNTWHGTPLKAMGRRMPGGLVDVANTQRNFLKSDYLLFSNAHSRERMMDDYMLRSTYAGQVLMMGSARNEVLLDEQRSGEVRKELGLEGKRVVLYMPTWRGRNTREIRSEGDLIDSHLSVLDGELTDDDILIVKAHHLGSDMAGNRWKHIRRAPSTYEVYDLLSIADVLITDYSSVMFDFAVTKREILLFTYDEEQYIRERDLYMSLAELPFPRYQTAEELARHLAEDSTFTASPEYDKFVETFAPYDGPAVSTALNDTVLAHRRVDSSTPPAVDVVFLPYLGAKGQAILEELLASGYHRDDVVFVFSMKRYAADANEYLHELHSTKGIRINYLVSTDRMLLTIRESLSLRLNRRLKIQTRTARQAYATEAKRLFGDMVIRCAVDRSGYHKFSELAKILNESRLEWRGRPPF